MTNSIYVRRLLNVAKAVRESPNPANFTLQREGRLDDNGVLLPCCPWGHYAMRRDLQTEFELLPSGFACSTRTGNSKIRYDDPLVQEHFGISQRETGELFGWNGCNNAKTPEEAAQYFEKFILRKFFSCPHKFDLGHWNNLTDDQRLNTVVSLHKELVRIQFFIRQLLSDLPQSRNWLDPVLENELKIFRDTEL